CDSSRRIACSAESDAAARYPRTKAASRAASRTVRSSSTINRFSNAGFSVVRKAGGKNEVGAMAAVIGFSIPEVLSLTEPIQVQRRERPPCLGIVGTYAFLV